MQLSTGNMVVDVLLCMLFPIVMSHLMTYWEAFKRWASKVRSVLCGV